MADNAERRPRQDTPKSRRVPKQNETYHACHKSRARKNRVCSWIDYKEQISLQLPCYNINSMVQKKAKSPVSATKISFSAFLTGLHQSLL